MTMIGLPFNHSQVYRHSTMSTSEQFCLKWNDFSHNVNTAFKELRDNTDFTDVTLVSEGKQQIAAHRVILSASSHVFWDMLRQNQHSHPFIYMRGIKAKVLASIVDFIYHGEVNIQQEELNDFMAIAEELELEGLTGASSMDQDFVETQSPKYRTQKISPTQEQAQKQTLLREHVRADKYIKDDTVTDDYKHHKIAKLP